MILYNPTVSGSLVVTGSLTTTGTITSQTLVVQTITSSIEFNTGSTRNGSLLTNTHEFTGSVGITGSGTATKLIVASDANAGTIDFGTGIYKGIMDYSAGSGLWRLNNQSAGAASTLYYQFQSDGTASMSILKNGNVGIGTTAPSTKLDVRGADIYLNISDTIDSRYVNLGNWIAGRTTLEVGGGDLFIKTQTSNYLAFGTFNTERMRLDVNGSLLLGTTTSFDSNYYGNIIHVQANENAAIRHRGAFSIANGSTKTLFVNNGSLIFVAENNTGDGALFHASYYSGTVTIIANPSGRFANTDTASKICVFKSAVTGTATLKNNAGSTLQFTTYIITCAD